MINRAIHRNKRSLLARSGPAANVYCGMKRLMITADGGGSNGSRLPALEDGAPNNSPTNRPIIRSCHYPPGTSEMEQDRTIACSANIPPRTGRAMPSRQLIYVVSRTDRQHHYEKGVSIRCELDPNTYPNAIFVKYVDMARFRGGPIDPGFRGDGCAEGLHCSAPAQ